MGSLSSTSRQVIERYLTDQEKQTYRDKVQQMENIQTDQPRTRYHHHIGFDGTLNDKKNVPLSDNPLQTNVATIYDLAKTASETNPNFEADYFPGVGTGGDMGGLVNAAVSPTKPVQIAAEQAYDAIATKYSEYLQKSNGGTAADISVSVTGFSRGTGPAAVLLNMLNELGLVHRKTGAVLVPPGVPVTGVVLFDPVHTGINLNMKMPPNVKGPILRVRATAEPRYIMIDPDYSKDSRVKTFELPADHTGIGGGRDHGGTGDAVLQGAAGYLRNMGVPLGDLAADRRFRADGPVPIYTQTARLAGNGDWMEDANGNPQRWGLVNDPALPRPTEPLRNGGANAPTLADTPFVREVNDIRARAAEQAKTDAAVVKPLWATAPYSTTGSGAFKPPHLEPMIIPRLQIAPWMTPSVLTEPLICKPATIKPWTIPPVKTEPVVCKPAQSWGQTLASMVAESLFFKPFEYAPFAFTQNSYAPRTQPNNFSKIGAADFSHFNPERSANGLLQSMASMASSASSIKPFTPPRRIFNNPNPFRPLPSFDNFTHNRGSAGSAFFTPPSRPSVFLAPEPYTLPMLTQAPQTCSRWGF